MRKPVAEMTRSELIEELTALYPRYDGLAKRLAGIRERMDEVKAAQATWNGETDE